MTADIIARAKAKQNADQIGNLTAIGINLLKEGFLFDGSDESAKFQALMDANAGKRVLVMFPHLKTISIKNITLNNITLIVEGNYCKVQGTSATDFIFKNTTGTGAILNVSNLELANISLADFELSGSDSAGTKIWAKNIIGNSTGQVGTFIKGRSTDFLNCENIYLYNYDTMFSVKSIFPGDRMNTQIHLKNIIGLYCNYGADFAGVDKLTINGFDIARCKTGMKIGLYTRRANISSFHVENHGYYTNTDSKDGYGIYIYNPNYITDVKFQECDITLPSSNALGGIYMVPTNVTDVEANKIIFENVSVPASASPTGYTALNLSGNFRWRGTWQYTDVDAKVAGQTNNKTLGGIVQPTGNYYTSRNLLSVNKITALTDFGFKDGTGDVTLSTSNGLTVMTNNSGADLKYSLLFTPDQVGWYTFIFNGDCGDTVNPLTVLMGSSPYTALLTNYVMNPYPFNTNRLYFYVPASFLMQLRLRFTVANGKSISLGDVGVYKGFRTEF